MRFCHVYLAPLSIALLLACTAVQDETPKANPAPRDFRELENVPEQLAQYPGAPFEARNGDLWFGTVLSGLIRYDGKEFVTFTVDDGLAGQIIRGIVEDDEGVLWIGTNGGVSTYDGDSFTTLTDYGDTPVRHSFDNEGDHLDIWEVFRDSHGELWIATLDGVFRYDGERFSPFPLPMRVTRQRYEFAPKMVYDIFEDRDGVLWFATDGGGAVSYDGTNMVAYTTEKDGLCSDRICTIYQDKRGDFWFGSSDGGVSRYDGTSFTTHMRTPTFSKHHGWGRCMAITEDRDGYVWFGVANAGGGAYRYDGETFEHFVGEGSLGTGGVPSIKTDRAGNLWFGTTGGVYRYDGETFVNFTKND